MKHGIIAAIAASSLVLLQGCENLTPEQRTIVGITGGAAAGLITAEVTGRGRRLAADRRPDWRCGGNGRRPELGHRAMRLRARGWHLFHRALSVTRKHTRKETFVATSKDPPFL